MLRGAQAKKGAHGRASSRKWECLANFLNDGCSYRPGVRSKDYVDETNSSPVEMSLGF